MGPTLARAACLVALAAFARGQTLVAHYELDEKRGTVAVDALCSGNPGKWSGGVKPDQPAAAAGTARSVFLDGVDGHALVPNVPALDALRSDFTVMAWVKPTTFKTWERVFGNHLSWAFGMQNDRILFTTRGIKDYISAPAAQLNAWTHIAVVFDAAFVAHFYRNGQLLDSVAGGAPANAPLPDWFIGAKDATVATGEHFAGTIDEIQIYSGSLTATQIQALYAAPSSTLGAPGAVSYCTAKTNSCGQRPVIGSAGQPSASASTGFEVLAAGVRAQKHAVLLYTDAGRGNLPFSGGTLCIAPISLSKTPAVQEALGTPKQCDGMLLLDMNAFAAGQLGGTPLASLSVPGTQVNCQWWGRDTQAHGTLLSDALEYVICP